MKKDSLYKISVGSTERWCSFFLIQLSLDAPPLTAISALSPLPSSTYSRASRPEQNPTRTVTRAFRTNTPTILGQVGNHKNALGGPATEDTMISLQIQARLLRAKSPPPSGCSGLVQSPRLSYIRDGCESSSGKDALVHRE